MLSNEPYRQYLTEIPDSLMLNIDNLTVYHYCTYFGARELFINIKIFNNRKRGDVPPLIKSLKQVFEERMSLTCDSGPSECWISGEDGRALVGIADERGERELVHKLVKQGASILDAPDLMFYHNVNKDDKLKYLISLLDGDSDTSSRYNMSELFSEHDNHVKRRYISEVFGRGGSVNITDKYGSTPLHIAVRTERMNWVQILLNNRADINAADNQGYTPLYHAAQFNDVDYVTILLNNGANVNITDNLGQTPLHYAFRIGKSECIRVLVDYGARMDVEDREGWTPLDFARKYNYSE